MKSKRTSQIVLVWLFVLSISLLGLAGCGGSSDPKLKPTMDVAVMARQTVSAIYTLTAVANPTQAPATPTLEPTNTPTQVPAEPTAANQNPETAPTAAPSAAAISPVVETPGGVGMEPTRNVAFETPSGRITMEPYKGATTEPTKAP
jgi:translation initiation factor IF-2